jgi:hypothetical protein
MNVFEIFTAPGLIHRLENRESGDDGPWLFARDWYDIAAGELRERSLPEVKEPQPAEASM